MRDRGGSDIAAILHAHWRAILLVVVATLGAGVFTALIVTLGEANRQRDRALDLQSHSFEVMLRTRALAETMARAEATLGRYVISADKKIGQQYSEEWQQAGRQLDRLDQLTRDTPEQNRRVGALRAAYESRGDELSIIALSTRYKKNQQALSRYYAAADADALHRTGRLLQGFLDSERMLLERRTAVADASVTSSNRAAAVLAVFGAAIVLGAILLGWLTVRAQTARAIAAAEAEDERERAELLEVAVRTTTEDLEAEARERAAAEAKLRQMQTLDAIGQLTGGIAHDFNNMLAVVLGGIELAKRHSDDPGEVVRHLDSAAEGADRAAALTRRLLTFARAEALQPVAVEAASVIAGMSDLIDRTLGDLVTVQVTDDSGGWQVFVDPHGLENAVLNLAVNARDAMDGRGTLTIATGHATLRDHQVDHCAAGDYVTIVVTDTGCGMSEAVIARVFEPFFTTKPIGKGTGLGLSQIFGFVQQSGGAVAIRSAPGAGCTVTVYLPRHIVAQAVSSDAIDTFPVALDVPAATTLDILVVEDDPRVLAATIGALEALGHRPVACADPLRAESVVEEHGRRFDLILSDVLMPGRTGPELVADLTARLPDAAVLFVTGFSGDAGEQGGLAGRQVLRKPFTMAALAAAIDAAIAARPAAEAIRSAA
ncbi:ATP-binding protein [uncultured Sphingomonas sp.]|uniref:ATP-binding protein n=1 Tax=uncultured Sphingomonas sp. TaxID=158754 RepID=UPI0025E755D5|nr:ATP-binding protein [uncultured Sphingomonas sp.]